MRERKNENVREMKTERERDGEGERKCQRSYSQLQVDFSARYIGEKAAVIVIITVTWIFS